MAPIMAIFAVLLLGAIAIATDLSVTTHYKRYLQNVTDAASLAGAKLLPVTPTTGADPSNQAQAAEAALKVVHNSYQFWTAGNNWDRNLVNTAGACTASGCSVTVCAGLTAPTACTETVSQGSAPAMWLTVNTPPKTAQVARYNGDMHRVEVLMHQQGGAFFAGIFGQNKSQDAAQSIAYHFAPGQPFPFALFSRTIIGDGNSPEIISGNIYADRYIDPQDNGHALVCAAPDMNNNLGYIFLGYPQQDDGAAYHNDGQSTSRGDPIIDNVTCPTAASGSCGSIGCGNVAMSANPAVTGCAAGLPGNTSSSNLTFDAPDGACEANPPVTPPSVATLPNLPVYGSTKCGNAGLVSVSGQSEFVPWEYSCPGGGVALTVHFLLQPGIYEIDKGTGSCDVVIDDNILDLTGVTFYLKGGAVICVNPSSGVTISQTPYDGGTGEPGDGRYVVLSDSVGNPGITMGGHGGGSTSGIWSLTGVIWLPTGTVTIPNKNAIQDQGQIIVNTWDDKSGNHQNPSVSYNGSFAPPQKETLKLTE